MRMILSLLLMLLAVPAFAHPPCGAPPPKKKVAAVAKPNVARNLNSGRYVSLKPDTVYVERVVERTLNPAVCYIEQPRQSRAPLYILGAVALAALLVAAHDDDGGVQITVGASASANADANGGWWHGHGKGKH